MPDLKKLRDDIVKELERLNFLEHIQGLAGRLGETKEHYTAEFRFRVIDEGKLRKFADYLLQNQTHYESELAIDKTPTEYEYSNSCHILVVSYRRKPAEQEKELISSLSSILKDLRDYHD